MYVIRPTQAGTIPICTRRNAMNGKSGVASDSLVTDCSTSRAWGPATDNPTSDRPRTSNCTSLGDGRWARNHREWCTSAICEPNRKNSSSPVRATENSPTIRPSGLSIGVSAMRPGFGSRLVNRPCSHSADPGPVTRYLAKLEHSVSPTRSRTARHSSATTGNALDRRNVTSSTGSSPGRWNHSACSSPKPAPHTALCAVNRSYTGVVCNGRPAGSSSLGNVMRKRRL